MKLKLFALLCVFICIAASLPMATEGQDVQGVTINMVGESRRTGPGGLDVMVAGIFHNITVLLDSPTENVTVRAVWEGSHPTANYTNTYRWDYDNGTWTDVLYDYYLNASACVKSGNSYIFSVAIDTTAKNGTWRYRISVNGLEIRDRAFLVEVPTAGIYMSAPKFNFRIMPYGTGYINSYKPDDPSNSTYLTTRNIGNTPLDISISYDVFAGLFGTSNTTGVWHPGEERRHYVDFQAQSWSPRKFTVKGIVHGQPRLLATPETISCTVTPQTSFDVIVTVARQGYEVFQLDNITVQYRPMLISWYKETMEFDLWVTGTSGAYLDMEGDSVSINRAELLSEKVDTPMLLSLSEDVETHVAVNITCDVSPLFGQKSMTAHVNFTVEKVDFSKSGEFQNIIIVQSVAEDDDGGGGLGPPSIIAISIVVIMVAVFLGFAIMAKRKAELEKRKELEDRIRRKKEKARRKRKG